jgi:hypothetical protein
VKSIASFFPKRERKPNRLFECIVRPTQALLASVVVFVVAIWPILTLQLVRPTGWFGDSLSVLCATSSVFTGPSLCVAIFMDIVRRRADARLLIAFVLSLAGVAAMVAFIYLRIHQYEHGA